MSRLFLNELPSWVTESEINIKFYKFGTITDIKIMQKKCGKKRNFGFIGFFDKNSAKKAKKSLDPCFFGNNKIIISEAFPKKPILYSIDVKREIDSNLDKQISKSRKILEKVTENGRVFVRNFPTQCTFDDIKNLFKPFGFLSSIYFFKTDSKKNFSKQAFIQFGVPECAIKAACSLDGKIFRGRILHVLTFSPKILDFNQKKKEWLLCKFKRIKKKVDFNYSFDQISWFTFFVSSEDLLDNFFTKVGRSKNVFDDYKNVRLNPEKGSVTEARLHNEIAIILKLHGVNLNVFSPNFIYKKSKRIFFLKHVNIRSKNSFKKALRKFGKIIKLVNAPLVGFILIEFQKKKEARKAFLYFESEIKSEKKIIIEWAPVNSVKNFKPIKIRKNLKIKNISSVPSQPLSFSLDKKKVYFISKFLRKKKNCSFGQKSINFFLKPHRELFLKDSQNKFSQTINFPNKILVQNIPFHVKIKKVKKIFQNSGRIISIRMPKKKSGQHKGFAFIEYKSFEEAKKTVLFGQNIYLQSRHLSVRLLADN